MTCDSNSNNLTNALLLVNLQKNQAAMSHQKIKKRKKGLI